MNKKYFKILKIVLLFLIIVFLIYNSYSYADLDVSSTADEFIQAGASAPSTGENRTAMNSAISDIAGLLTGLGIIVAVVIAAVLGIQFMIGSVEQQAKVKDAIIPYLVGCVVVFGALGIWRLVISALNQTMPT